MKPKDILIQMTEGRKVIKIKMTTLSEARKMNIKFMFAGWGRRTPIGKHQPKKETPTVIDSSNREEIFNFIGKFYTDDSLVKITYYDGDRTPTGQLSKRKGAVKPFQVIQFGFSTPKSTFKIKDSVREIIKLKKSEDDDYSELFNHLIEAYGYKSIQMYTDNYTLYEGRNVNWFNNNIRKYFENEPEGKVLTLTVKMDYDDEITGATDEFIYLILENGTYLDIINKKQSKIYTNMIDYYKNKSIL